MIRISPIDYWMSRISYRCFKWLCGAGNLESTWLAERLSSLEIAKPVYITGLARSGSTLLLELLSQHPQLATHRYADFPFIATPYIWSRFCAALARSQKEQTPRERAHQDGMKVTSQSPESMEEPIWQAWFPDLHRGMSSEILSEQISNPDFESFYRQHIKKMLLIRSGLRYLAKNNYLVTRLGYLLKICPDARFVVPIRHPVAHVDSLVRQHRLFCDYALKDARVSGLMIASGHYEFGPQRQAIVIEPQGAIRTDQYWQVGQEHLGYAVQWASLYGELLRFLKDHSGHQDKILIVRYEDFCRTPSLGMREIVEHCELSASEVDLSGVHSTRIGRLDSTSGSTRLEEQIWAEAGPVAAKFGYQRESA